MSEPLGIPKDDVEAAIGLKKLAVMNPPQHRDPRPVTNLGRVFGQFAELQQQIAEQVVSLEDSVYQQRQDIAVAVSQMPELRERINWLIASFYEQSKKDESVRDRLTRHDETLAMLVESSRAMAEKQARWTAAIDEVINSLVKAKTLLAETK